MIKEIIDNIQFEFSGHTLVKMRYVGDHEVRDIDSVIIPSEIKGKPIYMIQKEVFNVKIDSLKNNHIKTLIISNGINEIEQNAFDGINVDEVVWPSSCKKISKRCFAHSKIKNISNIQDVEEIEDSAFEYCEKLKLIVWPPKCIIPRMCFFYCTSLKEFDFKNIYAIKSDAFYGAGLTTATETSSIKEIGEGAFSLCKELKEFTWPDTCSTIPQQCFADSGIEKISNLKAVKEIQEGAFNGCPLKSLDLRDSLINNQMVYVDDLAFDNIESITILK